MNEPRYRLILNISGKTKDQLEEDWQELAERLNILRYRVLPFYRADLLNNIIKQQMILGANKPNKKVYRSVKKKLEELEIAVRNLGGRSR